MYFYCLITNLLWDVRTQLVYVIMVFIYLFTYNLLTH